MNRLMLWTRRTFLKQTSLTAFAAHVGWRPSGQLFTARALGLTTVLDRPDGAVLGHLAPDSVHTVHEAGPWFVMEHGYVARTDMQPISPYTPPAIETQINTPFWAELNAPSSVIRAWASDRARPLATLGYGAVIQVIGALTDDAQQVWYETPQNGWANARHFARAALSPPNSGLLQLRVNVRQLTLRLYSGRRLLVQSAYYGGAVLRAGQMTLHPVSPFQPNSTAGGSWQMRLQSGESVYGVYCHNRFGIAGGGADLELPIGAAKAIYAAIRNRSCIVVV